MVNLYLIFAGSEPDGEFFVRNQITTQNKGYQF